MPETLSALEQDRSELLRQISQLGDLRPGSILAAMGRCSKPNCHCARPNDPGHGPNFRLTRKVKGKTVAESLSSPAALRKAPKEVAEYHRFRELSQKFVQTNEKICRLRPVVEEPLSAQEKKRRRRSNRRSREK